MKTELNTQELDPGKIAKLLDCSTQRLDGRVVSALNLARNNALQRQPAYAYALAPATARWTHWLAPHSAQQWLAAAVLVAVIISGAGYWHHTQEQQISELDVAILTDELPIEVFVD